MRRPRLERTRRLAGVVAGMLTIAVSPASAQQDSSASELRTVLRAFYFNLAHQDWEAIAADGCSLDLPLWHRLRRSG
jgi:hypothetical protein